MKTLIFLLLLITTLNGQLQAQSKKTIDSLRAKLPEIEKNDTTFLTTNAYYFIPYYFNINIDSSIFFIGKSIAISKKNKWVESEIGALNNLAFAYTKKGLYFKSIDINYKALMLAEREKKQAFSYLIKRLLGESYMSLGQYPMAESLLKSSYLDAIKNGDEYEQLANLNQLGNLYKEQKRYIEAEAYYKKALPIAIKMNDKHTLGVAYHNLALSLSLQKKTKEALPLFEKSFALHKSENSYYSLGNLNVDLAELYHSTGDFNKSNKFASDGIKNGKLSNSERVISNGNYWLYKNYSALGQKEKALAAFEKYISLNDSLNKYEFDKRIQSLQYEYDISKKETKISSQNVEILKKTNENLILQKNRSFIIGITVIILLIAAFLFYNRWQLKKLNSVLDDKVKVRTQELMQANADLIRKNEEISQALFKGQNIERKRVASELHDNLSSLLSALKMNLGALDTRNYSDAEKKIYGGLKSMLADAYTEVRNISHNILPGELEKMGLAVTIENLVKKLNLNGIINFEFLNQTSERIDSKIEFNLYSIFFELINNVIKHSEAKNVTIELKYTQIAAVLNIKDDGVGFRKTEKNSQGLTNIQNRVKALNGNVNFNSEYQKGTEVFVSVPI